MGSAAWEALTPSECAAAGEEILRIVQQAVRAGPLPAFLKHRIFEQHGPPPSIESLNLSVRAFNRLSVVACPTHPRFELGPYDPARLESLTVDEFLAVRGVGVRTLVELLIAVETFSDFSAQAEPCGGEWGNGSPTGAGERLQEVIQALELVDALPAAHRIRRGDVRFGPGVAALNANGETLWETAHAIRGSAARLLRPGEVAARIRSLVTGIENAVGLTLDQELSAIVAAIANPQTGKRFVRSRGWDGSGRKSLAESGRQSGLSREGIRQIERRVLARLARRSVFAPCLERAEEVLRAAIPCLGDRLQSELTEAGLTAGRFCITGLVDALAVIRGVRDLSVEKFGGSLFVQSSEAAGGKDAGEARIVRETVRRICRKQAAHYGAGRVDSCVEELVHARVSTAEDLRPLVRDSVQADPKLAWVDEDRGWFWKPGIRNPILKDARKIVSVCGEIDVSLLREGVERRRRRDGFTLPPCEVLLALCGSTTEMKVAGQLVRWVSETGWPEVLKANERVLAEVLSRNGGWMRRSELQEACSARGVSRSSFDQLTVYSPILVHYPPLVFGIRGRRLPAGGVQRTRPIVSLGKALIDGGWVGQERVWLAYRLSSAMSRKGICGIPASLRSVFSGRYLVTRGEAPVGEVRFGARYCSGLAPLFREGAFQAGDVVVLLFNVAERTVEVHHGGHDLLEAFKERGGSKAPSGG